MPYMCYVSYLYNRMWWFELADMALKLFLTSIIGFFASDAQMPVGICVLVCFIIVRTPFIPYLPLPYHTVIILMYMYVCNSSYC
jgi:hypothetical protein